MKFTENQITSFQKLYKEELGLEITKREASAKALALIRYSGILPLIKDTAGNNPVSP